MKRIFALIVILLMSGAWSTQTNASELVDLPEIAVLDAEENITTAVYSPDDKFILTGDEKGYINVFNASTGALVNKWQGDDDTRISKIVLSPDGQRLASISPYYYNEEIKIWDVQTGILLSSLITDKEHYIVLNDIAFNHDGTVLYAADSLGNVTYWNVASENKGTGIEDAVYAVFPSM